MKASILIFEMPRKYADNGSIYCKLRETDSFIPPRLNESGQTVWSSFEFRKGRREKTDFDEIIDDCFGKPTESVVLFKQEKALAILMFCLFITTRVLY